MNLESNFARVIHWYQYESHSDRNHSIYHNAVYHNAGPLTLCLARICYPNAPSFTLPSLLNVIYFERHTESERVISFSGYHSPILISPVAFVFPVYCSVAAASPFQTFSLSLSFSGTHRVALCGPRISPQHSSLSGISFLLISCPIHHCQ